MDDEDRYDNPDELIEEVWPYDGPHTPESVAAALTAMGCLLRYTNNATWKPKTVPYAPHVYRALGHINSVVYGLDQLLEQLSAALGRHSDDPSLYDDRRDRDGDATAAEAIVQIRAMRGALAQAASQGDAAVALTSHLGHDTVEG